MGLAAGLLFSEASSAAVGAPRSRASEIRSQPGYLGALVASFVVYLAYAGYDWMWELTAVSMLAWSPPAIALGSAGAVRAAALDWRIAGCWRCSR